MKYKNKIGTDIIPEVQKKILVLKRSKMTSVRPVLIYAGELAEEVIQAQYFSNIIDVGSWLK